MILIQKMFGSSVGKKALTAITGIGLAGFLVVHMSGNLLMFIGPEAMNSYAVGLRKILALGGFPAGLWIARGGLLVMFLLHVYLAIDLTRQNRAARPIGYEHQNTVEASIASRTMIYTGLLVLAFLVYHLLHFTFGATHPAHFQMKDHLLRHDAYSMVVLGFRQPVVFVTYMVALVLLALHLYHGVGSLFQTLGWVRLGAYPLLKRIGMGLTVVLVLGFGSVPVSIILRIIKLPGE